LRQRTSARLWNSVREIIGTCPDMVTSDKTAEVEEQKNDSCHCQRSVWVGWLELSEDVLNLCSSWATCARADKGAPLYSAKLFELKW
jgi:hypothetical protein